jgi:hypothetical protein
MKMLFIHAINEERKVLDEFFAPPYGILYLASYLRNRAGTTISRLSNAPT